MQLEYLHPDIVHPFDVVAVHEDGAVLLYARDDPATRLVASTPGCDPPPPANNWRGNNWRWCIGDLTDNIVPGQQTYWLVGYGEPTVVRAVAALVAQTPGWRRTPRTPGFLCRAVRRWRPPLNPECAARALAHQVRRHLRRGAEVAAEPTAA